MEFIYILENYKMENALLALGVFAAAALLKKALCKTKHCRFVKYLPFALGIIFYCVFCLIAKKELNYLSVVANGAEISAVSLVFYYIFNKIFDCGYKINLDKIKALLKDIVSDSRLFSHDLAKNAYRLLNDKDLCIEYIITQLKENVKEKSDENQLNGLAEEIYSLLNGH